MTTATQVLGGEICGGGAAHSSHGEDDGGDELHCYRLMQ